MSELWPSVKVSTLTEQAYDILRERVLSGRVPPGSFIREQEVSDALRISRTPVREALGRLATVRLLPPGEGEDGVMVDVLFTSSGIEADICRDAERLEVAPGLVVPVASTGHLVAMKLLALTSDRPQDGVDLRALVSRLSPDDRARARAAVARIEDVGANRSKPLRADLEHWLS